MYDFTSGNFKLRDAGMVVVRDAAPEKRSREAFMYMEPLEPKDQFAECGTCRSRLLGATRCQILGPSFEITPTSSCGAYVHGPEDPDDAPEAYTTSQQVGFVRTKPRCENCISIDGKKCSFYALLNKLAPETFSLNEDIDPKGCCNAQISGEKVATSDSGCGCAKCKQQTER